MSVETGGRAVAVALMLVVAGCGGGDSGPSVVLSLRSAPVALGPGEAPALVFGADGHVAAWDADNAGSREVRYRRFAPGGVLGQDVVVGGGAQPRLAALGGQVGLSWIGNEVATGDDEVFFALAETGAASGMVQVTKLAASGDFPVHDLIRLTSGYASVVCHRHQDGSGSIVFTVIEAGVARPSVTVAPVRCKDISAFLNGSEVWIAYTEDAASNSAFVRQVDLSGAALGTPFRLGAVGQASSAPRTMSLVDAIGVVFHDGASEQPVLQRFDSMGGVSGAAAGLDVGGAVAPTFGVAALQPGVLAVYRQGTTLRARAFDGTGAVDSVVLDVGPGSATVPVMARVSNEAVGLLYVDAGMVTFAEVIATR